MTITLKQVASDAGVSYQTVWRALHDSPGILPGTRAHVLAVAARLGYRRNSVASSLRTARSHTIGLVVLDVSNPYTGELVGGVEAAATQAGCSVLLMNSGDDPGRERLAVHALMERRVDGIILNPSSLGDHSYLLRDLPSGFPLISINRPIPDVPCVTVESRHEDVALGIRFLLDRGHRHIGGIFGDFGNTPFRDRHAALCSTLEEAGLAPDPRWLRHGANTVAFARAAVREVLSTANAPTGLVAGGNRLTEGALLGLRDLGLRQGIDVALVGFDLRYAALLDPPLPVLLQPGHAMGRLAAEMLLNPAGGGEARRVNILPLRFEPHGG